MPFALTPEDPPRGDAPRPEGHERVYLAKTAAYELALVTTPVGPPMVHLWFVGQRRTVVLTVAEWEAFAAAIRPSDRCGLDHRSSGTTPKRFGSLRTRSR
jgi:hypothetical protein